MYPVFVHFSFRAVCIEFSFRTGKILSNQLYYIQETYEHYRNREATGTDKDSICPPQI